MVYGRKQASTYVTNTLPQCNPASVGLAQAWMYTNDNLVSRPLVCVHNNTRLAKSGEGLWAFITWMTSGGREVDGGGGAKLPKQYTGSSVRVLYCSFGLQMLAWSKLLILTGKKLAFKFSAYIFEYQPLPPYVRLTSTHVMNAPRLLVFCQSFAPVYYSERKRKVKMGEAWEWGYNNESLGNIMWSWIPFGLLLCVQILWVSLF